MTMNTIVWIPTIAVVLFAVWYVGYTVARTWRKIRITLIRQRILSVLKTAKKLQKDGLFETAAGEAFQEEAKLVNAKLQFCLGLFKHLERGRDLMDCVDLPLYSRKSVDAYLHLLFLVIGGQRSMTEFEFNTTITFFAPGFKYVSFPPFQIKEWPLEVVECDYEEMDTLWGVVRNLQRKIEETSLSTASLL